jgi:hypothetical protein
MKTIKVLAGIFLLMLLIIAMTLLCVMAKNKPDSSALAVILGVYLGALSTPIAKWFKNIKP